MSHRAALTAALLLAAPAVALAQPGSPAPAGYYSAGGAGTVAGNGGFQPRAGRLTLGASLGLGAMESESGPISCATCDYNPIAVGGSMHIGLMLSDRLAVALELAANGQTVQEQVGGSQTLIQSAALIAAQYWATPKLWVKGGLGAAHLSFSYEDAFGSFEEPIDDGAAALAAVGYEVASGRRHVVDLQARILVGTYDGIGDQISAAQIGVGVSWF